jgi:hypothetical protein
LTPVSVRAGAPHVHVFTHIRWQMRCYIVTCEETTAQALATDAPGFTGGTPAYRSSPEVVKYTDPPSLTWVTPEELTDAYALPTAFRIFLPEILAQ